MSGTPSSGRSGITFIELLVAVLVAMIVLLAAGSVYLSTERSFRTGARKVVAQQEASLLSKVINRQIRSGSSFQIYRLPDRSTPADSGNGLAVFDEGGGLIGRIEWSSDLQTFVDSTGNRVTAMKLRDVQFRRNPAEARTVRYRYQTDDENGNLVPIEAAATLRN
ncbi:MAG: hypothetical protein GF346_06870 [Candidatus Eisenbacteria bacterium]|nr:hypothetical protein [Candidatus Latescibacterota bacterium]MBD3302151.1 hypothetical protein [Candidatus Eisenbacteria bacterium]